EVPNEGTPQGAAKAGVKTEGPIRLLQQPKLLRGEAVPQRVLSQFTKVVVEDPLSCPQNLAIRWANPGNVPASDLTRSFFRWCGRWRWRLSGWQMSASARYSSG